MVKPKLDLASVTEETALSTGIGLDSLSMLLMGLGIEQKFEIHFDSKSTFKTVKDVIDAIEKQI